MNGCAHSFPGGAPDWSAQTGCKTPSLNFIASVKESMFNYKIFIVTVVVVAAVKMIGTGFEVGLAKLKTLSEN